MKANVVVLGKNYSTPLGVARSLAKADYRVEVLYIATHAGDSKIVASCKYIDRLVEIVGRHDQEVIDALTERFAEEGQKKVLFPTDDYTASLIDRYSNVLQDRFLLPHVVSGTVTQSMDKSVQSVLAKKAGLHTATEWVVSLDTDDIAIPEGIVFPCFVKPMVSAMGGKSELEKCESLQALQNKLVKMRTRQRDRSVLIQEFLNIRQEYTIGGVCNDQEIVLPAIIKKSVVARHNRGVTLQGTIVENDELSEYLSTIIGFLKSVRFVGMFDMEVLMTDKGLYFGELNLRAGGPSYSYFHSGVNLPDLAVRAICGDSLETGRNQLIPGKRFLNNKVAWEDFASGFLSGKDMKRLYRESEFTLLTDESDPVPEQLFNKEMKPQYQKKRMKLKIKKLLGRA